MTFLPHARRIYAASVRMTSGFRSMRPLAHRDVASYAIRVPRVRSLPSASFRFRLAADTLTVRLGVPVIKASTGTSTRQVNSRLAFAHRLQRQVMTLRVMPDARKKKTRTEQSTGAGHPRRIESLDYLLRRRQPRPTNRPTANSTIVDGSGM